MPGLPEVSFEWSKDMDLEETLNTLLVTLFQNILNIEEKALITGEFQDITVNGMHIIEAIGIGEPKTSSAVAKLLSVTMGTLTKEVDRLTRYGYVVRERSEEDKRLVLLSLTEKGVRAYYHHQKFHENMIQSVISQFDRKESEVLAKTLNGLIDYLKDNEEKNRKENMSGK